MILYIYIFFFFSVLFEKESTGAMLTVTVKFCKKDNYDDCIVEVNVLDRAIMPIPVCGADGSLFFPEGVCLLLELMIA